MSIFILDTDTAKCAQALDDKSLDKQIKAITQVLCNVHHMVAIKKLQDSKEHFVLVDIPLDLRELAHIEFSKWARECVANYKYLVELGLACCSEYIIRVNNDNTACRVAETLATELVKPVKDNDRVITLEAMLNNVRKVHKDGFVIEWARDNVPDFGDYSGLGRVAIKTDCTPFPLVMPEKYKWQAEHYSLSNQEFHDESIKSYRNYYTAKIKDKEVTFTRREKPEWLL